MASVADSVSVDDDPDLEHYLVRTRTEIASILRNIAERQVSIRMQFSHQPEPVYTRLLSIKPEYEELVFDAAGLRDIESLDGAQSLTAEARYNSIRYLFSSTHAEAAVYRGQPAFRARLPKAVARIQRRGSVRFPVPALNPPLVVLPMPNDSKRELHLRVMDISLAGAALVAENPDVPLARGMTLGRCRIHLPGCGAIETDLELSYISEMEGEKHWRRVGCRYSGLTLLALEHVRRYILSLEREHPHTD